MITVIRDGFALERSILIGVRHAQGSTPVVVYFPARSDFVIQRLGWGPPVAREVLRTEGIPFIDMTNCVSQLPSIERFRVVHYSPETNAAVGICLRNALASIIAGNSRHGW